MKKKVVSLLLAATMVFSLGGCGDKKSGPSGNVDENGVTTDEITLTFWHYEDETTMELMAEAFMNEYPNIKVEVRQIEDMSQDLSAAATAGNFPDVFAGTDSDTALANMYWADISEYYDADPETKNLLPTINEYGIGCFDTSARFAVPTQYFPSAIFIDRNVLQKLNIDMPRTDWTWAEMIDLIKAATQEPGGGEMKYFGLGYYNRLDSLYGIAATSPDVRAIKGEFGFNGTDFDLSYWAVGEQEFADLKQAGYVAPQTETQEMEDWTGDWEGYFGTTGHVAVFSEGFWTFMNIWGVEGYQDQWGLDIIPYVTPNVVDEKEHNVIGAMYMAGVSTSCQYPYEAYLLLKWMTFGVDGWNARLDIYEDETITNASNVPLRNAHMSMPLTMDQNVWYRYKKLFYHYEENKIYWDDFFDSVTRPVPYGWYNIAGYWNFCDQYFNKIGIHDLVDQGRGKAADYVEEATEQANYYHAEAMISYFGPDGYNVLSDEELAQYQAVVDSFMP
ncbi:MAG: carbohydrate ABC transporter substrate-binding protein [Lachnospiraceae bacterium]|nr:carbohydrate ABC transporter substrate-binding protein [Lachnospiraceae bacterium]